MSDWKDRLKRGLEPILMLPDPRPQVSAYHNMPCAIFYYPPEDELSVRSEVRLLATRLEQSGKRVTQISLADCLSEALAASGLTQERIADAERRVGVEKMADTVHAVISRRQPLDDAVAAKVPKDANPQRDIVFIVRAGALFPFYRTSSLLEQLSGKTTVPTILFYPGELEGATGLRFMGLLDAEHNYRPKIF